jgi:hypothetical protein
MPPPTTDAQLYLAIGVPVVSNAVMLMIAITSMNHRINDLRATMDARFASIETRIEILTGKVVELTDRVTRLEERRDHRP